MPKPELELNAAYATETGHEIQASPPSLRRKQVSGRCTFYGERNATVKGQKEHMQVTRQSTHCH